MTPVRIYDAADWRNESRQLPPEVARAVTKAVWAGQASTDPGVAGIAVGCARGWAARVRWGLVLWPFVVGAVLLWAEVRGEALESLGLTVLTVVVPAASAFALLRARRAERLNLAVARSGLDRPDDDR